MLCVSGERAKFMSPATIVARAGCADATSWTKLTRLFIWISFWAMVVFE